MVRDGAKTPDDTRIRRNTSDFLNEGGLSQSQQKKLLQRLQDQSKKYDTYHKSKCKKN